MADKVRIGIVGAGGWTVNRMLPGFQKAGEVTAVANRNRANAERVADQFGIENVLDDYKQVIGHPDVDAVFIGTAPNLHKEVALAALEAGKHVLCQTRMATTAADAREMYNAAQRARSRGVQTMLVPPGPFYSGRAYITHLVSAGAIGELRHVQAYNQNASMADSSTPLSQGRNNLELYGPYNAAQLGLTYDVLVPWAGHAKRVLAQRAFFTPERPETPGGPMAKTPYPDEVTAISENEGGAVVTNVLNWAAHFAESRVELYGSEGTIVYKQRGDVMLMGRKGDEVLQQVEIPPEHDGVWLVEDEFVRLCRGEIDEPSFTFYDGVKNMEYLEAAYTSAVEGRWVEMP